MAGPTSDPFSAEEGRTALRDESGRPLVWYSPSERFGDPAPRAESAWLPPGVGPDDAAGAIHRQLPGWTLATTDADLAQSLIRVGAAVSRHSHAMTRRPQRKVDPATVRSDAPPPTGTAVYPLSPGQLDRHALALAAVHARAYPPSHPDAEGDESAAASMLRAVARGEVLGPMLAESHVAIYGHRIAGACLVVDADAAPLGHGPWVLDLFRDPVAPPGTGAALLGAALAALAQGGAASVSLLVTHTNAPARHLYDRFGFREAGERWTLALPVPADEGRRR